MSELEKNVITDIVSLIQRMGAAQKERFVSWAEGVAFALERQRAR